jgi:pyridoxamine 5'-phosphate oxidase
MPDYSRPLREEDVDPDPLVQFARWFAGAGAAGVRMPEAVAVASATAAAVPSLRMVLLKHYDERGFVFFTNYASRKATELETNPRAALMFYWDPLGRQVRVEGPVARTSAEESAAYIASRPRASQLSALASPQSQTVPDRAALEARVAELSERYADVAPPLHAAWGGFRVAHERLEFWQNRDDRLHDRLVYTRSEAGGWAIERLAP